MAHYPRIFRQLPNGQWQYSDDHRATWHNITFTQL